MRVPFEAVHYIDALLLCAFRIQDSSKAPYRRERMSCVPRVFGGLFDLAIRVVLTIFLVNENIIKLLFY